MKIFFNLIPYILIALAWTILTTHSLKKIKGPLDIIAFITFLACTTFLSWEIITQHGLLLLYMLTAIIIGCLLGWLVKRYKRKKIL